MTETRLTPPITSAAGQIEPEALSALVRSAHYVRGVLALALEAQGDSAKAGAAAAALACLEPEVLLMAEATIDAWRAHLGHDQEDELGAEPEPDLGPVWVSWLKIVSPPDHWSAEGFTLDTVLADPAKWGASKVHATETSGVETSGGVAYCGAQLPPNDPDRQTYWTSSDDPTSSAHQTAPCKRCLRAAERRSS